MRLTLAALAVCLFLSPAAIPAAEPPAGIYAVGVAQIDITPSYPVRLSGFGFRRSESEGVTQKIWAKALAIDDGSPAVLVTVDNLGIPAAMTEEVAARLEKKAKLHGDRLAITATHTHTAPMLKGVAPTLFGMPIPKEHQEHIDRYTAELTDKLEKVALAALEDRKPARLRWGVGQVGFSVNRRTKGGPVDHDLPVLVVEDLKGKVRAVYVSYACHCVTLSNNKISGDWAGFAQERIQDDFPGAVALVSVGCGGDSNPSSGVTGDKVEVAQRQGSEVAAEVKRLAGGFLAPVAGKLTASLRRFELPLAEPPNREQWETKAKRTDAIGYHARVNLARLDNKEPLKTKIDYAVQTWAFGDSLAMVFLPGEVVVDYSLRLKRELDGLRLWLNAYANDAPCYIPSERVLKEGGYEGGGAMVYYDLPAPLAPGLEQKILDAVHEQIGQSFRAPFDTKKVGGTRPLPPPQSLSAIHAKPGLAVELVAAEPLLSSPVAIDWGPDGRLWVAEMVDYPSGTRGDFKPGGRVVVLESSRGDGRYDKSTVFLDNIPFPTGLTVWRKGVLVCAAPDILYAEDTKRDGKADVVKKLYSGFGTDNYQARVNSLEYGLDGWVHGSCGIFGGQIKTLKSDKPFALGDRDFRIRPDTGEIEPATGRTQQGRVRDDWGNWFGCDNSMLCRHYPLPDHYLRRNPHVAPPPSWVNVTDYADWRRLYPIKPDLQLLPRSGPPNQVTAACGLGVYRDDLLGKEYTGDAFVCEPVDLIVHRMKLTPKDSTFSSRRTPDEAESEFLGSTDNWCRFVQARTGPDGALWVVDMYRYVIEHPRWIPQEELAKMDVRAGSNMGRIYRVVPTGHARPMPRLDKLDTAGLVAALDSPNGWQRDLAGQMLVWNPDKDAVPALEKLTGGTRAEARLQALCVLAGLDRLRPEVIRPRLADPHPGVRRHAVRLAEKHLAADPEIGPALLPLLKDEDAQVRLQLAFTLGEWRDARASKALATLLLAHPDDEYLTAAVLSGVRGNNLAEVVTGVLPVGTGKAPPENTVRNLMALTGTMGDGKTLPRILRELTTPREGQFAPWQMAGLAGLLDALDRHGRSLDQVVDEQTRGPVGRMLARARTTAADDKASEEDRLAVLPFLGRDPKQRDADLDLLGKLLVPQSPVGLQAAAASTLGRIADERVPALLTAGWKAHTPALKSQALDLFLSRDAWQRQLLDFIYNKTIPAADVDATRRQRLLAHRDATFRDRAAKLFDGAVSPDRQKVLDAYKEAATLIGDARRGKAVFAKSCAACHSLEGVGHSVGPDLRTVATKSPLYLLTEILDPSRNVDSRYVSYVALTRAGRTFTGILSSESATSITLRGQEGKEQVLLRGELEELQGTGKSLMPEGLEKELTKQDLADVIAYLTAQDAPPKQFAGNEPTVVRPIEGALALLGTNAAIHGNEIAFEPEFRNVGMWHGEDDRVSWNLRLDKPGEFDVWLDWACADDSAGNAYVLEGVRPELRGKVQATGGWDRYRQAKIGTVELTAGAHKLTLRPDGKPNRALMDLRGLHLVPKGQTPKFAAEPPRSEDPAELARQLLDDKLPAAKRQEVIDAHPDQAAEIVVALVAKAKADGKGESGSIPGVWRVAIAAGKRNDAGQLRRLLDVSLPRGDDPLRQWQAVVIGGGVINGISLQGAWPKPRLAEILKDDPGLQERFRKILPQASAMADDEKVSTGTRYDALRLIALDDFEKRGDQLTKYVARGVHDELQMGAISGLSDVESPKVAELLLSGMAHYSPANRKLAIDALLRADARTAALLDALEQGKVKPDQLSEAQVKALREHKDEKLRARAGKVLPGKE
jgi:putative membrane-bound dehydrogenase-like protein